MRFALMMIFMELSMLRVGLLNSTPYPVEFQHFLLVVTLVALVMDIVDFFRGKS